LNDTNIRNYINDNFTLTPEGEALSPQQLPFVLNYVSNTVATQRVNASLSAERANHAAAVQAAVNAATSATPASSLKTFTILQKQLVPYDGKRNIQAYNQFFQQLDQLFAYQHTEKANPAHGPTPYYEAISWTEFRRRFCDAFYPVDAVTTARNKLSKRVQNKSCKAYTDKFHELCLQIPDLAESEKRYRYLDGLQSHVQYALRLEFKSQMDTVKFDDLAKAALAIDNIAYTTKGRNTPANRPYRAQPSGPTPMDIDSATATKKDNKQSNGARAPLTAVERKHLIANKGCFYCWKINCGHQVRNCLDKIAADKAKQVKVNAASATPAARSDSSSTPKSRNGSTRN
ncbi:hypothetical protein HK104_002358, partial [Borealophlyctis nickersoniae]